MVRHNDGPGGIAAGELSFQPIQRDLVGLFRIIRREQRPRPALRDQLIIADSSVSDCFAYDLISCDSKVAPQRASEKGDPIDFNRVVLEQIDVAAGDRKSTRLNSS